MSKIKLKKGDTVKVISGEARGQQGKIIAVDTKKLRATVEGVNMISKSEKPNAKNTNGGIVKKEGTIHISNLMFLEGGKTVRVSKKSNEKPAENEKKASSKKTKEAAK